jgi:hypothetical protein
MLTTKLISKIIISLLSILLLIIFSIWCYILSHVSDGEGAFFSFEMIMAIMLVQVGFPILFIYYSLWVGKSFVKLDWKAILHLTVNVLLGVGGTFLILIFLINH